MNNIKFKTLFPNLNCFISFHEVDETKLKLKFANSKIVKEKLLHYIDEDINNAKDFENYDFDLKGLFLKQKKVLDLLKSDTGFYSFKSEINRLINFHDPIMTYNEGTFKDKRRADTIISEFMTYFNTIIDISYYNLDYKKIDKEKMYHYINNDINKVKDYGKAIAYDKSYADFFSSKSFFREQKKYVELFNNELSFLQLCEKIDNLIIRIKDNEFITYSRGLSLGNKFTYGYTIDEHEFKDEYNIYSKNSSSFLKYLTDIRNILAWKNGYRSFRLILLLKNILVENCNYETGLELNTTIEYINKHAKTFTITKSRRSGTFSYRNKINIIEVNKIITKIKHKLINQNHFNSTIFTILKWYEMVFYINNLGITKLLYHDADLIINPITELLISLFIKSHNNELLNELYKIESKIFNSIEILDYLLNYYSDINDFDSFEETFNTLKKIDPYSTNIGDYENKLLRLKALDQLSTSFDYANINELSGIEFETIIKNKFIELGFKAELTKASGDFGADIIIETINNSRIAIQCKRFKNKVNLKAVQEVNSSLSHYGCDFGIVITNNTFLRSAITLAASNDIELWDNDKLLRFLIGDLSFSTINEL